MLISIFVLLVSNVVAPLVVAMEGVHWARDGPKFACRVDGYDAFYAAKYNLVQHLWLWSSINSDTHLFRRRAQGFKITWP